MGIRRYNPVTPGRRGATVSDFAELTPGAKPEKSLLRPEDQDGRPQQPGRLPRPASRRRSQAAMYRLIDFRRNKDGVPAKVDSIQYDPNRRPASPCCIMSMAKSDTSSPRTDLKAGDTVMSGADAPPNVGNCLPLQEHSARHVDSQHRIAAGSRRRALPLGRRKRHAGGPRSRLGPDQRCPAVKFAVCRLPAGPRSARSATRTTEAIVIGQGRPQSLAGPSPARPRHRDEPDRPSARWW